jgi:hypothetical protein
LRYDYEHRLQAGWRRLCVLLAVRQHDLGRVGRGAWAPLRGHATKRTQDSLRLEDSLGEPDATGEDF